LPVFGYVLLFAEAGLIGTGRTFALTDTFGAAWAPAGSPTAATARQARIEAVRSVRGRL